MLPHRAFRCLPLCAAALLLAGGIATADPTPLDELPPPHGMADAQGQLGLLSEPITMPAGPTPAVLVVHDALGPDLRALPYVAQLLGAGLAVLEVAPEDDEPFGERIRRALRLLAQQPRLRGAPIGMLAFGAGAHAAMLGVGEQSEVAARVLLYPGCRTLLRDLPEGARRGALLVIHGDADPANRAEDCAAVADRLALPHGRRPIVYRGAGYAWDFPSADPLAPWLYPAPGEAIRLRIQPAPALVSFSAAEAAAFLSSALGRTRRSRNADRRQGEATTTAWVMSRAPPFIGRRKIVASSVAAKPASRGILSRAALL